MERCSSEQCNNTDGSFFVTDHASGSIVCQLCGVVQMDNMIMYDYNTSVHSSVVKDNNFGSIVPSSLVFTTYKDDRLVYMSMKRLNAMLSYTYEQRLERKITEIVLNVGVQLNLPEPVVDETKYIFLKIRKKSSKIIRGNVRSGLIGACVYIACKIDGIERSKHDICKCLCISLTHFNKGNHLVHELTMDKEDEYTAKINANASYNTDNSEWDFLSKCIALKLSTRVKKRCVEKREILSSKFSHIMPKSFDASVVAFVVKKELRLETPDFVEIGTVFNVCVPVMKKTIASIKKITKSNSKTTKTISDLKIESKVKVTATGVKKTCDFLES